jgi:hypothetical protein
VDLGYLSILTQRLLYLILSVYMGPTRSVANRGGAEQGVFRATWDSGPSGGTRL